jgi:hypothetical protein
MAMHGDAIKNKKFTKPVRAQLGPAGMSVGLWNVGCGTGWRCGTDRTPDHSSRGRTILYFMI